MPAGKMIARYGLSAHDVQNLYSRYKKQKLKVGFGSFDSFVKFCAECEQSKCTT